MVQTIGHCSYKNPEDFLGTLTGNGPGVQPLDEAIGKPVLQQPTSPGTQPTQQLAPLKIDVKPATSGKGSYTNFTVGTSAVKILDKNPSRVSALIRQISSSNLYIGFDQGVSSTTGMLLNQNDSYEINQLNHFTGEIWAVANTSGQDVRVVEF